MRFNTVLLACVIGSSLSPAWAQYVPLPVCLNIDMWDATVGGDKIAGGVSVLGKPFGFAKVQLYSSSGKVAYLGVTDEHGGFATGVLSPDDYRLEIEGWGSASIHLTHDADRPYQGSFAPTFSLLLLDNGCVTVGVSEN